VEASEPSEFDHLGADADRLGVVTWRPPHRVELGTGPSRISALRWGDGAPSIVYVHGLGLQAHTWDSVELLLGAPAIAVDLPGHGDSPWRRDGAYSPFTMAPVLGAALRATVTAPLTLVGHSLGGLTSMALLGELPGLVDRLVLLDTAPEREEVETRSERIGPFIAGPESYADYDEIANRALAFGIGTDREALLQGIRMNTRVRDDGRVTFKHHLAVLPREQWAHFDARDLWPALESFEGSVLLLHGDRGSMVAADVERLRRRVSRFEAIELHAGHNVHRDQPQAVADAIRAFREH
jgi:pimeloyl-ACP methyl ester carboxylesterase